MAQSVDLTASSDDEVFISDYEPLPAKGDKITRNDNKKVKDIPHMMQARNWVFTLNNPTANIPFFPEWIKYCVYQKEMGKQGTPHFQGYVECNRTVRLSKLKKWLPRAHFEKRRGRADQARDYCMKEEGRLEPPIEHGRFKAPAQGKRNDLLEVQQAIKDGKTEEEIADKYFQVWVKYPKAITTYRSMIIEDRTEKSKVILKYGKPGTGKTHDAYTEYPTIWSKPHGKWWDGYNSTRDILIDDFYGWLEWNQLLSICDGKAASGEVKGAVIKLRPQTVVIITNQFPDTWYKQPYIRSNFGAFTRRVTEYHLYTGEQQQLGQPILKYDNWKDFREDCIQMGFITDNVTVNNQ